MPFQPFNHICNDDSDDDVDNDNDDDDDDDDDDSDGDDVDNCDDNDAWSNEMMMRNALYMYIVVIKRQTNMRCDS